jgi:acyl phosphate:glycerol-3-phosphate acyltransferase
MTESVDLAPEFAWLVGMFVLGYLLGSIPFGLIITRAAGLGDVRAIGSGNIGATNVLRTGRIGLAALTLLLDALKGAAAVWIAMLSGPEFLTPLAAGFGAFLGHLWPVWLGFKGGKGVATYLGVLAALAWKGAVAFAVVWVALAAIFRYSSLAALVAAVVVPIVVFVVADWRIGLLFTLMSLIVIVKHRANIFRLMAGTETRIGAKG